MKFLTSTAAAFLIFAASYGQSTQLSQTQESEEKPAPTVYVVGHTLNSKQHSTLVLWIDGTPNDFPDGCAPYSIFGVEDIICMAGDEEDHATLWKMEGGTTSKIRLSDKYSFGFSGFATKQGDIYVAGVEKDNAKELDTAVYWKVSGTAVKKIRLSPPFKGMEYQANSIWIAPNGKVYVAGIAGDLSADRSVAVLWINGVVQILPSGKRSAQAIAVYGNGKGDIYVAGWMYSPRSHAVIWKNNVLQRLAKGEEESGAWSVFVTGNGNMYVGGYIRKDDKDLAVVWKNGAKQYLPDGANVDAIYVTPKGDVYAAGTTYSEAKLWKNGELQTLIHTYNGGGTYANDVFVK